MRPVCTDSPCALCEVCRLGVRLPPALDSSMAVFSVHIENQLVPPPVRTVPSSRRYGVVLGTATRPGSPAPPTTRSPRVSMRITESPGISPSPPVALARVETYGS